MGNRATGRLRHVLVVALWSIAAPSLAAELVVNVRGLRASTGSVRLALFEKSDGFPDDEARALRTASAAIEAKSAVVRLTGLAPGTYTVGIYHDENGNRQLDTSLLGIPKEGVGASRNAVGTFGPPSYQDAAFPLSGDTTITVDLSHP